ncbi:NPC intracellular cholesterol transporter 2-like [Branchiostoma lanceolatum]|uniref:NPC intracellular cholesterol transporter 2-like n=1 Tax=Branchiostoma lanceolatum TaxID=7740 RepID=UPI003455836C
MALKHILFLACVGISVTSGNIVKYEDCGPKGKLATINYVDIKPCKEEPCQLVKGQDVSLTIDFTANKRITEVTAAVYGVIAGTSIPIPHPLPNPNGCKDPDSGLACPLAAGGSYQYTSTLKVLPIYQLISLPVKWELKDQNEDVITCVQVPVEISGGKKISG